MFSTILSQTGSEDPLRCLREFLQLTVRNGVSPAIC
jgi:hypothetical protein